MGSNTATQTALEVQRQVERGASLERVFRAVRDLVPFEAGLMSRFDVNDRTYTHVAGVVPARLERFVSDELDEDPVFERVRADRETIWLSQMGRQDRRASTTITDFVVPEGICEGVTQPLFSYSGEYVGVLNLAWYHHIDVDQDRRDPFRLLLPAIGAAVSSGEHRCRRPELSSREREVLHQIRAGHTNAQIGRVLGISTRTVATHVEHILAKLGVANRAAAAAFMTEGAYR